MGESWLPVIGYEGLYEVSDKGNVRSLFRYKKQLKPSKGNNGYLSVELFKGKQGKRVSIHRLVATAFISNPQNLPQVNHKDENKHNNCVENLEWCSAKYNMVYGTAMSRRIANTDYSSPRCLENARKNGATQSKPVLQFSKDGILLNRYSSGKEAYRKTGLSHSHILECCAGKRYKTVGGYIWKYDERNDDLLVSQF